MANPLDFSDYRKFLVTALDSGAEQKRGARARLSESIGCQPSYLSQVFKGQADLSLEQADRANRFFEHTDEESEYFLLLVSLGRAGSESLREQLGRQAKRIRDRHQTAGHRLATKDKLADEHRRIYFGNWQYAAVAMALTVPTLRTKEAICEQLKIPGRRVSEILKFLVEAGLAKSEQGAFSPGTTWLHLGDDPELATRDHISWRLKAMQSFDSLSPADLRYSSVASLSESDFRAIKAKLIHALEEIRATIKDSKEEKVCTLIVDFFGLSKN